MSDDLNNQMVEILLVEDNPTDIELTLMALKESNLGNKIHVVQDGEEALDFIFGKGKFEKRNSVLKPKVILLDLKLPKIGGIDVLKTIRADERTKLIPVVVLTSSREERDIIDTYKLGVNSYIVKPVQFENFAKTVKELGLYWIILNQPPVM
jgi:two-component system, response regulator